MHPIADSWVESAEVLPDNSPVELRDGTRVFIRSIRADDAPRLQTLFARLSPESIFFRFLTYWKELPRERAEYLARVDYRTRMAFVATLERRGGEEIVGIASYAVLPPRESGTAEAAIVVEDEYQNLGLGTVLLTRLGRYARSNNICAFVGTIHAENEQMLRWIENCGVVAEWSGLTDGASDIQLRIELPSDLDG